MKLSKFFKIKKTHQEDEIPLTRESREKEAKLAKPTSKRESREKQKGTSSKAAAAGGSREKTYEAKDYLREEREKEERESQEKEAKLAQPTSKREKEEQPTSSAPSEPSAPFAQDFLPEGWPRMSTATTRIVYDYPSKRIQEKTGFGRLCSFCYAGLEHNNANSMRSPVLLTNCLHINCKGCVINNSQPVLLNLDPKTQKRHPYILASHDYPGHQCPTCNLAFTWASVYDFYL